MWPDNFGFVTPDFFTYAGGQYFPIAEYDYNTGTIKLNTNGVDREKLLSLLETNNRNTKETNKMEAKKCDRCGKLYEMPGATESEGAEVRFKFIKVSDAENKSGTKIAKEQMRNIYIKKTSCCDSYSGVDLCPDCRKSLKKWFESTDKEEKKNV
ncbi:MAG: hypothetical protein J6Y02_21010 [Pseudobutyrivibrio sp.]|nr:hypothetical protein [Pseudobutyrivibrio sp.]